MLSLCSQVRFWWEDINWAVGLVCIVLEVFWSCFGSSHLMTERGQQGKWKAMCKSLLDPICFHIWVISARRKMKGACPFSSGYQGWIILKQLLYSCVTWVSDSCCWRASAVARNSSRWRSWEWARYTPWALRTQKQLPWWWTAAATEHSQTACSCCSKGWSANPRLLQRES